jgi:hypothetical protein
VTIRPYQSGDEHAQVTIYNAAAALLPKFKPAALPEVQRRIRVRDFDPTTRFYAVEGGQVVGYCTIQPNGRVGYPWCVPGQEAHAKPLLAAALAGLAERGVTRPFTAYRGDWPAINQFFVDNGFRPVREIVSFVMNFLDMPTPSVRPTNAISPLLPADVAAVLALGAGVLQITSAVALEKYLFKNPYFPATALFALRSAPSATLLAVGIFITEPMYADPRVIDANMPCYRLGAFGTEGMSTKRVKGLFSFIARPDRALPGYAMDLLGYAATHIGIDEDMECCAAQVPSDAPALMGFYQRHFQRQGSFPVLERGPLAG